MRPLWGRCGRISQGRGSHRTRVHRIPHPAISQGRAQRKEPERCEQIWRLVRCSLAASRAARRGGVGSGGGVRCPHSPELLQLDRSSAWEKLPLLLSLSPLALAHNKPPNKRARLSLSVKAKRSARRRPPHTTHQSVTHKLDVPFDLRQ